MRLKSRRSAAIANLVLFEALESRTHFDLVPVAVTGQPADAIATVKTTNTITVTLQNTGDAKIRGAYELILLVSPSGGLGDATIVKMKNEVLPTLAAGATRNVTIPLGAIPDVAGGDNFLEAEVGGDFAGIGDTFVDSTSEILITDPFINLTDSVLYNGDVFSFDPGVTVKETVQIFNQGNVPAKGALQIQLGTSLSSDGSGATVFSTPTVHINIAPDAHVNVHFFRKIAKGTVPADYFATATVDPNNTFNESDTTDNFSVSSPGLTILDPFPDISGASSGPFDTTSGPGKGDMGTLTLDLAESDTTGGLSGTGTNSLGGSFNVTGTITTTGLITIHTGDVGDVITSVLTGKVVDGTIVGKFRESTRDAGTFTLTLA